MITLTNLEAIIKRGGEPLFVSPPLLILFNDESSVFNSADLLSNQGKWFFKQSSPLLFHFLDKVDGSGEVIGVAVCPGS